MNSDFSKIAPEILEMSSEQRLAIIDILSKQNSKLFEIVKTLSATSSEVHRNLSRLTKAKIISKDADGYFLTSYGVVLYSQISTWKFFSQHKSFFSKHQLGDLPKKFTQRLGALSD
jgi:predicted transcriptional regulator